MRSSVTVPHLVITDLTETIPFTTIITNEDIQNTESG